MVQTDIPKRKEEILQWIKEERPKAFMCRELRCKPETLESHLKKLGISYKGNPFVEISVSDYEVRYEVCKMVVKEFLENKITVQALQKKVNEIESNWKWG